MRTVKKPVNLRDLGGIPAAEGKTVAPRRLLRSGEIVGLTNREKSILLRRHDLQCIIDLRGVDELAEKPDDTLRGVAYHNIDIMGREPEDAPDEDHLKTMIKNPHRADSLMQKAYILMVKDPEARKGFRQMIEILLKQKAGACLFHCYAGKDRTGMAAAIILTLLGVSKEEILKDYLRTNKMRRKANAILLREQRQSGLFTKEQMGAMHIALIVKPTFLGQGYATAEEEFGSFEGYIEKGIGVTPAMASQLRDMYLV